MRSHPVVANEWKAFADQFSRAHEGWIASLEVREGGEPLRVQVDDSPFRGATVDKRDGRDTLVLTFGYEPEEHFAHIIHSPRALLTSETDDRSEASLIVESSDGGRCILELWNPLREEELVMA